MENCILWASLSKTLHNNVVTNKFWIDSDRVISCSRNRSRISMCESEENRADRAQTNFIHLSHSFRLQEQGYLLDRLCDLFDELVKSENLAQVCWYQVYWNLTSFSNNWSRINFSRESAHTSMVNPRDSPLHTTYDESKSTLMQVTAALLLHWSTWRGSSSDTQAFYYHQRLCSDFWSWP